MIDLCRELRCHVHIVHLSSADALPDDRPGTRAGAAALRRDLSPLSRLSPPKRFPTATRAYKCAPPIRERENRERLWEGLRAGLIDTIGSDHSPAPPELKHLDTG